MEDIREIVTKAIIAKGKKQIVLNQIIKLDNLKSDNTLINNIDKILGIVINNQNYQAKFTKANEVNVEGSSVVNLWASFNNNTLTDVIYQDINFNETVNIKNVIETNNQNSQIVVHNKVEPYAKDVQINGNEINLNLVFDIIVEIIGETKVKVIVCDKITPIDEDYFDEINENFIVECKEGM